MSLRRTSPYLSQLENDKQLQARIDAVEARVERTFQSPAKRLLAYLGKQQRLASNGQRLEEQSGT